MKQNHSLTTEVQLSSWTRSKQFRALTAGAIVLSIASAVYGDEKLATPPAVSSSAPPSAGLFNDWLRSQSAEFNPWDIGGQVRARYEWKENGGVTGNSD